MLVPPDCAQPLNGVVISRGNWIGRGTVYVTLDKRQGFRQEAVKRMPDWTLVGNVISLRNMSVRSSALALSIGYLFQEPCHLVAGPVHLFLHGPVLVGL